jgi:hypothetical protein
MNCGDNIFDHLEARNIEYFVSDPSLSEEANLHALIDVIEQEKIDFAFLYWPGLDGLLHEVGNDSPRVPARLRLYEDWIGRLLRRAGEHYSSIRLYLFSDHGMANCDELLDLQSRLKNLQARMEKDYAVVYDSTMARFWFFNEAARNEVHRALDEVPEGRVLSDQELDELHALFPDRYFGQTIFLVREGVLIVPSHMGERPIRAMHGYHPREKHSYAALFTNRESVPKEIRNIRDMYRLMKEEAELAHATNGSPAPICGMDHAGPLHSGDARCGDAFLESGRI